MPTAKQHIISTVTSAAMHLLHESSLYGSELWPVNDFVAGFHGADFIDDRIYIGVMFRAAAEDLHWRQSMAIILHSIDMERIKEQAKVVDIIFEDAIHSGVMFTIYNQNEIAAEYRYWRGGIGSVDNNYIHLKYTYTLQ